MYARVSSFQERSDALDESTRVAREELVPTLEAMPGFLGVQSLIDRASGRTLAITFWETEEAMRASEAEADRLRTQGGDRTGAEIRAVDRYEVALRIGV